MRGKKKEYDLHVLEALGNYGPRNLAEIARKLGINAGSLRKRLKRRLSSDLFLNINVYHTNLGLRKCVVFADAVKGREELLYNSFKIPDFWLYLSRCYGAFEGCMAIFGIPVGKENRFQAYLKEVEKKSIGRNLKLFWSTCFHTVNPTSNWFDVENEKWVFKWDRWVEEIYTKKALLPKLPVTLIDPTEYPQKADYADVIILKELEKDATTTLTEIGRKLEVTKQDVKYHFEKHVLKYGLIESFQVISFPYEKAVSDFYFLSLWFPTEAEMAKFAMTLLDKPFTRSIGKVYGESALLVQLYLPRLEFREFVDRLSELCRKGFLKDYWYVIQDWRKIERETIPYKLFTKRSWLYDHDSYVNALDALEKTISN
jgi:DNA-binding Lrp family transcriptional regulator